MGFFRKIGDSDRVKIEALEQAWEKDPSEVIARFIAGSPDPLTVLARVLVLLVGQEVLSSEALETLGVDSREMSNIMSALASENPSVVLHYETEVRKAMGFYNAQVCEIVAESGVVLSDAEHTDFSRSLASFASDNSITDLKIAYRLMRAEGGDPLKDKPRSPGAQGYL